MKKNIKTLFILMGLGLFTFIGINTVKAQDAFATNFNIVCEPGEIEKGDKALCYMIGKVTNDTESGNGVHGLITKVSTSHLDITSYKAGNGGTTYVAETIKNGQKFSAKTPASSYTCNSQGEPCYGFFTAGADKPGAFKNTGKTGISSIDSKYSGYTSFGYFEVQLDESATTNECGKLCVYASYVSDATKYTNPTNIGVQAVCSEIKPKITPSPNTGSFASITVLIAGGLIAIGAIAIAKKNNKIYRV